MSEIGEDFAALHEESAARKKRNLKYSTDKLVELGISFESKNGGVHLIVYGKDGLIDYWPSTGKFIIRSSCKSGRGLNNILKLCETS